MADLSASRRLVAGNWKMNLDFEAGIELATACLEGLRAVELPVVLCMPAIHLQAIHSMLESIPNVHCGAQDTSQFGSGAHTGDLSASQLRSVGCDFVIVGHSERRQDHGEAGEMLAAKVHAVLDSHMRPIYCFGETLNQRESGSAESIVAAQLAEGLNQLSAAQMSKVVLAYEPIWAIGTGKTATSAQAQEIHAYVRHWLAERFDESLASNATILYGGSVKPDNAAELFAQADIDGGLIGGASLNAADFLAIVNAYA